MRAFHLLGSGLQGLSLLAKGGLCLRPLMQALPGQDKREPSLSSVQGFCSLVALKLKHESEVSGRLVKIQIVRPLP